MGKSCSKCENYGTLGKWCLAGMNETIADCPRYVLIGSVRYVSALDERDENGDFIYKIHEGPLNWEKQMGECE